MDIFTALSKIWGFFIVILMILILDRLHLFFVFKRLKRDLESIKTNHPYFLLDLKNSAIKTEDSNQLMKKLSGHLDPMIKIKEIGVFYFNSEDHVIIFNILGKKKKLLYEDALPKSHSKNRYIERVSIRISKMELNTFSFYHKGKSIEVYYKLKDMCDSLEHLLFIDIKITSIFSLIK